MITVILLVLKVMILFTVIEKINKVEESVFIWLAVLITKFAKT